MSRITKTAAAIDIGNSRIKIMLEQNFKALEYYTGWEDEVVSFLQSFNEKQLLIGYSSVSDVRLLNLKTALQSRLNCIIIDAKMLLDKQHLLKYKHIKGMGTDRLLGLAGALSYAKTSLMTVDCGTAITINGLKKLSDNHFEAVGGAIFAGIETQIRALHEYTSLLPEIDIHYEETVSGKNTEHALRSGIISSAVGGIHKIIYKMVVQEFEGENVPVFITGGSVEKLLPALTGSKPELIHKPHLVPEGIYYLLHNYGI